MADINETPRPDKKGLRNFGYVMACAVVALFGLLLPWALDRPQLLWPWVAAAILAGLGCFKPASLAPLFHLWMKFGLAMNKITTPLILGIVFFLVITPFGVVMRIFDRDPLERNRDFDCESYRIPSEQPEPGDIERPF